MFKCVQMCTSTLLALLVCGRAAAQNNSVNDGVERKLEIRYAEEVATQGRLRVFARFGEFQAGQRYLVSTLDLAAFKLLPVDTDDNLSPVSLSTFSNVTPALERALFMGLEQAKNMDVLAAQVRQNAAEFLGSLRTNFFSVQAFHLGGVEPLAESVPGQAENMKAIQKRIIDSNSLWEMGDIVQGACAVPRQFEQWREMVGGPSSQRAAVLISRASRLSLNSERLIACLNTLAGMGVQTFWIRLDSREDSHIAIESAVQQGFLATGGYVHSVPPDGDMLGALSNVRSHLDDEYVVEFQLPRELRKRPNFNFALQTSYHGNFTKSAVSRVRIEPVVDEELVAQQQRNKIWGAAWTVLGVVSLATVAALVYAKRAKRKYIFCKACGYEVRKDFSDCPFKSEKCFARLVVLSGVDVGKVFPLFENDNFLGRASGCGVRFTASSFRKRHAKISLFKKKALYQKLEETDDRVNGWPVQEPRLLGHGAIIQVGDSRLRFECKE